MRRQINILRELQGVGCTRSEGACGEGVAAVRLGGRQRPVIGCPVSSLRKLGLDPESHGNSPSGSREDTEFIGERKNVAVTFWGLN